MFGKVPKILPAFRKTLKLEMWILGFEVLVLAAILASKATLQTIGIAAGAWLGLGYLFWRFCKSRGKSPSQIAIGLVLGCGGVLAFRAYLGILAPWYLAWGSEKAEAPSAFWRGGLILFLLLLVIAGLGWLIWLGAGSWIPLRPIR